MAHIKVIYINVYICYNPPRSFEVPSRLTFEEPLLQSFRDKRLCAARTSFGSPDARLKQEKNHSFHWKTVMFMFGWYQIYTMLLLIMLILCWKRGNIVRTSHVQGDSGCYAATLLRQHWHKDAVGSCARRKLHEIFFVIPCYPLVI